MYHRNRTIVSILAVIAVAAVTNGVAQADSVGSRENERGSINLVKRGLKQLTIDIPFILSYLNENDNSSTRISGALTGGVRYFVKDNVGVSVRLSGIYRKAEDARDLGAMGAAWINYYARVGNSAFLAPGIGAGFMYTNRDIPMPGGVSDRSNVYSFALPMELPFVFYASRNWSLRAGPDLLVLVGRNVHETRDSSTTIAVDGGFKVGVDWNF